MRVQGLGFIGAALALHLAIPGLARIAPRWQAPILARSSHEAPLEAIDVEVAPPLPHEPPPERVAPEPVPPPPEARVVPRDSEPSRVAPPSPDTNVAPEPVPSTAPSAEPSPAPTPKPDEYGGPPAAPGLPGAPGLGSQPVWALPGVLPNAPIAGAAPTSSPAARPTERDTATKVLSAAMNAKNHEIGLDLPGAGTIAARIVEAVWASDTPAEARGTFQVRLGANGKVQSVRYVASSGGPSDSWRRVASLASSNLAAFTLVMTSAYATGAVITVQVVSKVLMPAGASHTLTFDLSDIGAKKHRVVTSSFSVAPAT